jgi:hypothetical protein
MGKITEVLSLDYVNSVLQYGVGIDKMITKLEEKGHQLAQTLKSLEELEGEAEVKDKLRILKKCPMVAVLDAVKKINATLIGEENLPDFYPLIVEQYSKKHSDDCAILHPLCIAHQHIRRAFGEKHQLKIQQIACRSDSTGRVVFSKKGLGEAGLTQGEANQIISQNACLYICEKG